MPTKAAQNSSAAEFLPKSNTLSLPVLRKAAAICRGCELCEKGTQTVFGEGAASARVMMVGEQPGDKEDIEGRPFVGPAGKILDRAMQEAGIDRKSVYLTNAVKHFNWTPKGKLRQHSKPKASHIRACRPWLEAEVQAVQPRVVIALGATAAQAMQGASFRVTQQRGVVLRDTRWADAWTATMHPSAVLRQRDKPEREAAYEELVADLVVARDALEA